MNAENQADNTDNTDNNDLKDLLADKAGGTATTIQAGEVGRQAPASATVLQLDRWGLHRGTDLSREWIDAEAGEVDPTVAADAHGALFEAAPVQAERPADAQRAAYWKQLMETPEYASLHRQTMLDAEMSALAAKGICDEYASYVKENPPEENGKPGDQPGSDGESVQKQLARIRSTGKALAQAQEDVSTAHDVAAGLGIGAGGQLDKASLARAFKRVRQSDLLRKVMEMAGRMISRCRTLQRQKLTAKHGEITGIELGGKINRLVPRERLALAGAMGPELQDRAEYRLLRRRALSYRKKVNTPVAAGAIVCSVDESGSMGGEKIIAAKAMALTLAWLAGQQNRWIALVGFSGSTEGNAVAFPPGHRNMDELIEWVEHFFSGGTDLDCPCETVPNRLYGEWLTQGLSRGKADHIIITDAIVECPDSLVESYTAWAKGEKVKTYGLVVEQTDPGYLAKIADRCWCIPAIDLESSAVEEVFSI